MNFPALEDTNIDCVAEWFSFVALGYFPIFTVVLPLHVS